MAQVTVSERVPLNAATAGLEFDGRRLSGDKSTTSSVLDKMVSEGGKDFYNYLSWNGLSGEPNIMVLSSLHHYYYDHNDLKGIRMLVNMKKINQVTHLESFLHALFRLLPSKSHFVGCFCKTKEETGKSLRQRPVKFFRGLLSGTSGGGGRTLTKESISKLLENNGFILNDLTDINGMTYFRAQNNRRLGD
ncbi:MAG: hypothetical protein WAW07_02275 [Bacteroidales bacterium]